jgi:hypothetical protein
MRDARTLLERNVASGKVMQLSTLAPDGGPVVCNLWFASAFAPDRLWFISRHTREHSANIRADGRVAGAILAIEIDELGQAVQGVTFNGIARELPTTGIDDQIEAYLARWPKAAGALDRDRLARGEAHHRVYEIVVASWVLFDEEHFPSDPRRVVPAH